MRDERCAFCGQISKMLGASGAPVYYDGVWCSRKCVEEQIEFAEPLLKKFTKRIEELRADLEYYEELQDRSQGILTDALACLRSLDIEPDFYRSRAWRELRYKAIELYGRKCHACGRTPEDGIKIHVDHIKPRSKHPELALEITNLQIMCDDCNLGKGNKYKTDWRPKNAPVKNGGLDLPDF